MLDYQIIDRKTVRVAIGNFKALAKQRKKCRSKYAAFTAVIDECQRYNVPTVIIQEIVFRAFYVVSQTKSAPFIIEAFNAILDKGKRMPIDEFYNCLKCEAASDVNAAMPVKPKIATQNICQPLKCLI